MQFPKNITAPIRRQSAFLIGQRRAWTKPVTENALAQTVADVPRSRQDRLLETDVFFGQGRPS
jgi:hypothetical protein